MSQRNPMNERYQNEDREGQTRKSAASAKPKRKAGETVVVKDAPKTDAEKRKEASAKRKQEQKRISAAGNPTSPEYKKFRKIWWILLGVAVGMTALSWVFQVWLPDVKNISYVVLALAYTGIIGAFYVDYKYVRPIRTAHQNKAAKPLSKNKQRQLDKKMAEEAAAKAAGKEAKKQGGGIASRFSMKNKRKADEVGALIEEETKAAKSIDDAATKSTDQKK